MMNTFHPDTFGEKSARMLNWMHWIRERGSKQWEMGPMFLLPESCVLDHVRFVPLVGTVEEADQLSVDFYGNAHLVFNAIRDIGGNDLATRQELQEVFGCVDEVRDPTIPRRREIPLRVNIQMMGRITNAIQSLRLDLHSKFISFDPMHFDKSVFSPIKFGWRNAYLLNCLHWVYETEARDWYQCTDPTRFWCDRLVTKMTGTESDAEWVSKYFLERLGLLLYPKLSDGVTRLEFMEAFLVDGVQEDSSLDRLKTELSHGVQDSSLVLDRLKTELSLLRVAIYSAPRFVAFMLGKNRRLGGTIASLGDDVCRMILTLSIA